MKRTPLFAAAAQLARDEGARVLTASPISVRLDLAVRTYRATKQEACSLETQYRAVRAVERLLGEACDELAGMTALERAKVSRVMVDAERELRAAAEQERRELVAGLDADERAT